MIGTIPLTYKSLLNSLITAAIPESHMQDFGSSDCWNRWEERMTGEGCPRLCWLLSWENGVSMESLRGRLVFMMDWAASQLSAISCSFGQSSCQAVMHSNMMLSRMHLKKMVRAIGNMPDCLFYGTWKKIWANGCNPHKGNATWTNLVDQVETRLLELWGCSTSRAKLLLELIFQIIDNRL